MRKFTNSVGVAVISLTALSGCATICGGSQYYAHVLVQNQPDAEVLYQGQIKGRGHASITVKRPHANRFSFAVQKKGCQTETFNYNSRAFRGWALAGSIFTWGYTGAAIDLIDGALWKPSVHEAGIVKTNVKNYQYIINYTGCQSSNKTEEPAVATQDDSTQDKLVDVVYLKNGSIIRGELMDSDPAVNVKIQTKDGSIFVFKIEEVIKVTRE
jgi:hypothetical protein